MQSKVSKVFDSKTSMKTMYAPLIMSLMNMATNADPASVEKILNLMNKIKTALRTSLDEDTANENQAIEDWKVERANIEHTIADLKSSIHETETEIMRLEELI